MAQEKAKDQALWSGRFSEPVSELVKRFTASVDFDRRLAEFDIDGSLAHARMLKACEIISADDLAKQNPTQYAQLYNSLKAKLGRNPNKTDIENAYTTMVLLMKGN